MRYAQQGTRYGSGGGRHVKIDLAKGAKILGPLIVGEIKLAVSQGKDRDGRQMAAYSQSYAEAKGAAGRDPSRVDLVLTGGLMGSLDVRRTVVTADGAEVDVGPDNARSPRVTLTPDGAKRTGKYGPPHNLVGMYLEQQGRKWLGLSKAAIARIAKALTGSKILLDGDR